VIEKNKIILEIARQMDEKDLILTVSDYKSINALFMKFIDTLHYEKIECPIFGRASLVADSEHQSSVDL
jgi:hypothetical protein